MSTTTKIVYTVVALIIVAFVGGLIVHYHNARNESAQSNSRSSGQQPQPSQQPQQTSSENSAATAYSGCPNGQDVNSIDPATGRFKPTIDVNNKVVTLQTTFGNIGIQLYGNDAPKTVENFICLAQKGYYNNTFFHRVAHGFVIQGGDPTGTGSGGQSIYGKPFADELYPDTPSYKAGYLKGVVAMANSGPNTNGSQFFILLADQSGLPHNYTIFGKVIAGQDVVDKIGALPIAVPVFGPDDGTPATKVYIRNAVVSDLKN